MKRLTNLFLLLMTLACLTTNAAGFRLSTDTSPPDVETSICRLTPQQAAALSSVYVTGQIQYTSGSGFARILLRSSDGCEKLVYESFPALAIDGIDEFDLTAIETSSMSGFTPACIVVQADGCDISGIDIYLNGIDEDLATDSLAYCTATAITSAEKVKLSDAPATYDNQTFVDRLNTALEANGALWRAKDTDISRLSYEEKKLFYGGMTPIPNGVEYYAGGIFSDYTDEELISALDTIFSSDYPKELDWRNRHNALKTGSPYYHGEIDDWEINGWCTPSKAKYRGTCWAFGSIGHFEVYSKLSLNTPYNFDLSEEYIINRCQAATSDDVRGGYHARKAYSLFAGSDGAINESSEDYSNYNDALSAAVYKIIAPGFKSSSHYGGFHNTIERTKGKLQQQPLGMNYSFKYTNNESKLDTGAHTMTLIGYKILEAGDSIRLNEYHDPAIVVPENHYLVGQTVWLFKNCMGTTWGNKGYGYYFIPYSFIGPFFEFNNGAIECVYNSENNTGNIVDSIGVEALTGSIPYYDKDGDGYYWWGIGPRPDLPDGARQEPDYDDSDWTIGAADDYGFPEILCDHDLYIRDNAGDAGFEPNMTAGDEYGNFWNSPDIWVRTDPAVSMTDDNPQPGTNHIYVRVWNRGKSSSPQGVLKMYWSKSGIDLPFPSSWDGSATVDSVTVSGKIPAEATVPSIAPGESTVVTIVWDAPSLDDGSCHFDLMAVVETDRDTVRFSAEDTKCLSEYVLRNGNVALKNLTILSGKNSYNSDISVITDEPHATPYAFDVVEIDRTAPDPIFEVAEVQLIMLETFAAAWESGGSQSTGFATSAVGENLIAQENYAELSGIGAASRLALQLQVNYLNGKNDGYKRSLLVRQKDKDGNIIGGHAFIINPIEFHVIEVTIEEAETASGITLTATGVSEEADYVWADSSGEVIATGETAVVPVSGTTESYIVQVTAKDDGLRAYARTDVTSDPLALSPNPATSHINVSFSLPTGSYTLCVYDGTTMQLAQSQSVSGGEQTISLDVSSMAAGVHVVNIIDATGAIVRTGKFIKN